MSTPTFTVTGRPPFCTAGSTMPLLAVEGQVPRRQSGWKSVAPRRSVWRGSEPPGRERAPRNGRWLVEERQSAGFSTTGAGYRLAPNPAACPLACSSRGTNFALELGCSLRRQLPRRLQCGCDAGACPAGTSSTCGRVRCRPWRPSGRLNEAASAGEPSGSRCAASTHFKGDSSAGVGLCSSVG